MTKDDDNTKSLEERIESLENQHIDIKVLTERVNNHKEISETKFATFRTLVITVISLLSIGGGGSFVYLKKSINHTVEKLAEERLSMVLEERHVKDIIEKRTSKAIAQIIKESEVKSKDKFSKTIDLFNQYLIRLNRLGLKNIVKSETISKETIKELEQFEEKLVQVKTEVSYSFDDWYYKGAGEFLNGRYDKAIASFTKSLDKESNDDSKAYALNYRGAAHVNNNEDDDALKDFERSIEFKPNNPLPYNNIGTVCLRRTEYKKAFENFNKASELYFSNGEYGKGIKNITVTLSTLDGIDMDPKTKATIREEVEQIKKHQEKELKKILGGGVTLETK